MTAKPLAEWRNRHAGADIWVVASGPSVGYLPDGLFDGRIVVGTNDVYRSLRCDYAVRKENDGSQQVIDHDPPVALIKGRADGGGGGFANPLEAVGEWWEFDHAPGRDGGTNDYSRIGSDDSLVVTWSTITTAMHFAAYLGAATVYVCGHDLGTIDGESNYPGYLQPGRYHEPQRNGSHAEWYAWWLLQIEEQSVTVRDRLVEVYGCNIVSVSPWLGHGLEGHKWRT